MRTSAAGIAFMKSYDKRWLVPYKDPGGNATIGWGHLIGHDENFTSLTPDQADALFISDLGARAEEPVLYSVDADLEQYEFDALVSLCFNIGAGNFEGSTLVKLINSDNRAAAAHQFLVWDHIDGMVSNGLLARRQAEQDMFLKGNYVNHL